MSNKNLIRQQIQDAAVASNIQADGFSTLAMATRSGKSRCAVLRAIQIFEQNPNAKIFLVVPTTKLKNLNWKEEFIKWGAEYIYNNNLTRSCYISMQKYKNEIFDLLIADECHHITEANLDFFENNEIKSIIGLTATFPKTGIKKDILNALAPVSFTYTLEQGVNDGIITPFEIHVLKCKLNSIDKNIKAGNLKNRWFQTEATKYEYIQNKFDKCKNELQQFSSTYYEWYNINSLLIEQQNYQTKLEQQNYLNKIEYLKKNKETITFERARFIYNLKTKTDLAKKLISKLHKNNLRYIVFCGSIEQANILGGENVFHSNVKDTAFQKFKDKEINTIAVVNGLNEGITIENIDFAIAVQINSQELNLIQRIGRIICLREGHIAKFYIIVCEDTQDQKWLEKAILSFDESVIFYHNIEDFFYNYEE